MPRTAKSFGDTSFLAAALQGLEMQKTRIEEQIEQVRSMMGHRPAAGASALKPARKRRLSAAARKRIAVAQKRRWAEYRRKAAAGKQG